MSRFNERCMVHYIYSSIRNETFAEYIDFATTTKYLNAVCKKLYFYLICIYILLYRFFQIYQFFQQLSAEIKSDNLTDKDTDNLSARNGKKAFDPHDAYSIIICQKHKQLSYSVLEEKPKKSNGCYALLFTMSRGFNRLKYFSNYGKDLR